MSYRYWTKEEDELLLDKYGKCHIDSLSRYLNRTPSAIIRRIRVIEGMSDCSNISGNLKTSEVSEIMGVTRKTINSWINNKEIPYIKPNSHNLIIEAEFWKWLRNNLHKVNFMNIDDSIEFIVPKWYRIEIKEYKRNFTKLNSDRQIKWTQYEETIAWDMFVKGYTNNQIAVKLERKLLSVKNKMYQMKKKKLKKAG